MLLIDKRRWLSIAKRIEKGEQDVLDVFINSQLTIQEILSISEQLKNGQVKVRDIVRDFDEEEGDRISTGREYYWTDRYFT